MGRSGLEPQTVETVQDVEEGRGDRGEDGNLILALDHETLQELKDHAYAELLTEKLFGTEA